MSELLEIAVFQVAVMSEMSGIVGNHSVSHLGDVRIAGNTSVSRRCHGCQDVGMSELFEITVFLVEVIASQRRRG